MITREEAERRAKELAGTFCLGNAHALIAACADALLSVAAEERAGCAALLDGEAKSWRLYGAMMADGSNDRLECCRIENTYWMAARAIRRRAAAEG